MFKKIFFLLILFFVLIFSGHFVFAAVPSASDQMSGQERARQMQEQEENLENQVLAPKVKSKQKQNSKQQELPESPTAPRGFVKIINVTGVTVFRDEQIKAITGQYENKNLTIKEIQQIASRITYIYRKKGYVTSRAYIPPQKIKEGILEIKVLESTVGEIKVKGNRFHKTKLIFKYLTIKKGELFNYNVLKYDLENINDQPDIHVRAILLPGQNSGSTDIILEVEDSLPMHVSMSYNNYLSSFLKRNIFSTTVTDNNLLGQDDILSFEFERGDDYNYFSYTTRYLYPLTRSLDLGAYVTRSKEVLGGEFSDLDSRGTSTMYGMYGTQNLIKNDDLTSNFNFGFDYINVYNYLVGELSSADHLRVARAGFDLNLSDDWGRTFISDDYNYGIPGIMGGTAEHLTPTDTPTSRTGAGGQFVKDTLNILRLQELPFDATLLWKNQLQFSPSTLTSTEQFQIGGPDNNRGYPVANSVGDEGYTMSWELAQPVYPVPNYWKVPFTNARIYDAVRIIEFYDWSNVHLNSLQPGDEKNMTLSSAGTGIKLNILKNISASYEIGWPLTSKPSDGNGVQHWIEVTITY